MQSSLFDPEQYVLFGPNDYEDNNQESITDPRMPSPYATPEPQPQ